MWSPCIDAQQSRHSPDHNVAVPHMFLPSSETITATGSPGRGVGTRSNGEEGDIRWQQPPEEIDLNGISPCFLIIISTLGVQLL